jgi:hypothetical protein
MLLTELSPAGVADSSASVASRGLTCGGYTRETVFLNASSPDGATSRPSWTTAYQDYLRNRNPKYSLAKAVSRASRRAYTSQAKSTSIAATIDDRDHVKANLFQAFLELYSICRWAKTKRGGGDV